MKQATGFLLLACIAGLLIALTRGFTTQRITNNEQRREAAIVADLLGGTPDPTAARRLCRRDVRGYAGNISLLVLPSQPGKQKSDQQKIVSARVTRHRETPGIGDFIDLHVSDWMLNFRDLPFGEDPRSTAVNWNKTLDAVTGATVTRRAVITGIANACKTTEPEQGS